MFLLFFFFNDTATTEIYTNLNTLSLHDALPISPHPAPRPLPRRRRNRGVGRSEEHTSELQSHSEISYAVFCLKKKKKSSNKKPAILQQFEKKKQNRYSRPTCLIRCVRSHGLLCSSFFFFFFNDTATTEIYTNLNTLSLHDALPISSHIQKSRMPSSACDWRSEEHTSELQSPSEISYAVFCLQK